VPRRDLHGDHAGFLGLAGRRRGAGGVAAARADELRQGSAGAGRARLARGVAGAVPRRAGGGALLSSLETARRALELAEEDDAEAVVLAERSGFARFAGS